MNNYRGILEEFKNKLEVSIRGSSKEIRLNKQEMDRIYQALTNLLLINAELRLTNEALKSSVKDTDPGYVEIDLDGGSFKE